MKRFFQIMLVAAAAAAAVSCGKSNIDQMKMAENIKISCTPEVLSAVAGKVPATITVEYPEGYFHQSAIMMVTPVFVYEGGQQTGNAFMYQGEKVKDNYKVVPASGGKMTENVEFTYVDGAQKSYIELRPVIFFEAKKFELPAIKVADGCNVTCLLADTRGKTQYKKDNYQEVVKQTAEGQILYAVNSAEVRGGQLNSSSINSYRESLKEMSGSDRVKVKGTQIVAYASPEGGEELNAKLSDNRAKSAQDAWKSIGKGMEASGTEIKSIGQDWEGFQEAVANSNIEDKELILRVLSMYSDPAIRENEIRNMSQIYGELKEEVFPELRRARFITEMEYQNYTEEELLQIAARRLYMLDEDGVLRVAALTGDKDKQEMYYRLAAERYGSDTGYYNMAMINLDKGIPSVAEVYLNKVGNQDDPDVINAKGAIAMRAGKYAEAAELFKKAGNADAKANLGTLSLIAGNYAEAAKYLEGSGTVNEALAYILNGDNAKAESVLNGEDAVSEYLKAIVAARKGDARAVKAALDKVGALDPALKERALKDVEFAAFAN